jgi:serine/threonine protein kinase
VNDQIGKGSYGLVYRGADIRNGNLIAVKTISTSNIKKDP